MSIGWSIYILIFIFYVAIPLKAKFNIPFFSKFSPLLQTFMLFL